jgi:hypothetical protein
MTCALAVGCGARSAPMVTADTTGHQAGGDASKRLQPAPITCTPPPAARIDIEFVAQRSPGLCWAAVTEMIASSFGIQIDQCSIIQARKPLCARAVCPVMARQSSRDDQLRDACEGGAWPDFDSVGLAGFRRRGGALTLDELKQEIGCRRRPVVFSWKTGGASGHMMVAYGYSDGRIEVADPGAPRTDMKRTITHDVYDRGNVPGTTEHWDDFYGFHLKMD